MGRRASGVAILVVAAVLLSGVRTTAQIFTDVPSNHWAYSFVERLAASEITGGCGGSNYCPDDPVTRAQMAVFLERGINGSGYAPPDATGVFADVSISHWAASWIEQLAVDGITSGCGGDNYCPDEPVTRAQMAVFLERAMNGSSYNPPSGAGIFGDVPTSHWACDWIEQLAADEITSGCGGDDYCPGDTVTRAQMAVFLVRAFNLDDDFGEDQFTYDVEWEDDVTVVDAEMLTGEAGETHTYTLDGDAVAAAGLDLSPGQVIVLSGTALRRITSSVETASEIVVETEYVTLTEAVRNGTVAWDYGVEFTDRVIQKAIILHDGERTVRRAVANQIEITDLKIGDFTHNISLDLQGTKMLANYTVEKSVGGNVSVRLTADGMIQRFRSKNQVVITENQLTDFDNSFDGMQGELTLKLVVAASGTDAVTLELPVVLLEIPVPVPGPIPAIIRLKLFVVFNASVPVDGSSQVETKFTYNSNLGLAFDGASVQAGGSLGSIGFGDPEAQTGASGAVGANFGIGFPRLELSLFADSIVPWAHTAFLVGGSFTVIPPCQTGDARFIGAMGFDLGFLGLPLLSSSYTLFDEEHELLRTAECPE